MYYSKETIDRTISEIRNGTNAAFEEWAQYGIDTEIFIDILRWITCETQEEREGTLKWARAIGLTVPHMIVRTLGGAWKFQQTGPARLHRLLNVYHKLTGLAFVHDFDTKEDWLYHDWPHLTLEDIVDQKPYPLELSGHPHPELEKYILPNQTSGPGN